MTLLLQSHLPTITTKLYSESIISSDALLEAVNENHIASVRTVSLLSVVEDKIRAEPHVFTKFVKILESEPTLRSQANELVKKYRHGMYIRDFTFLNSLILMQGQIKKPREGGIVTVNNFCIFMPSRSARGVDLRACPLEISKARGSSEF